MTSIRLKQLLFRLGQTGILSSVDALAESASVTLENTLLASDLNIIEQEVGLAKSERFHFTEHSPLKTYLTGTKEPHIGQNLLKQGKVGAIILAGGQGSRFGHKSPKGLYPLSLIKQKGLLQLFLEKSAACGRAYANMPHVAIMTSESTHDETQAYIQNGSYFGLPQAHVDLFKQPSLPLLNTQGDLVINDQGQLLTGPDGNGALFSHFAQSGILEKWKKQGIQYISVVLVDNALLDPFPIEMLSEHVKHGVQITAGAIMRDDPEEQVGVFVLRENKVGVVEYSEMTTTDAESVDQKGNLIYSLANLSYFVFSTSFVEAALSAKLPLHKASKKATDDQLAFLQRKEPLQLYKFEYFIFDLLEHAAKTQVFLFDRPECFAPLKNGSGRESIASVQKALLERDRRQYERITGVPAPKDRLFELSMGFYYPSPALMQAWKGKPLPNSAYIEDTL